MSWVNSDFITPEDLGLAYRRAKADLYYDGTHQKDFELCEYEENLRANLDKLLTQLSQSSLDWMIEQQFVGDWSVIPRNINDEPKDKNKIRTRCFQSDPDKWWEARVQELSPEKPKALFRLVGDHSIDFHIVSALWILKVGHIYDAALGPEAYGNRVTFNRLARGSFKPYPRQYRLWRDKGMRAMRQALDDEKRVVAVTADARLFYHSTSPDFLLHDSYLKVIKLDDKLDANSKRLTRALIDAIHAWALRTPLHLSDPSVGIPVGLSASPLIANAALAELDIEIRRELAPLYYGRYVDDLLLVLENTRDFKNEREVWDFISQRVGLDTVAEPPTIGTRFHRDYLGNSQIIFSGEKQKVFLLEGASGKTVIETIERQARARTSEWRALPDVPERLDALSAKVLAAINDDGEEVDNLRKMDELSTRRQVIAFLLRDMEAFELDLSPEDWKDQRLAFWQVIIGSVIALPELLAFAPYLARVFGLAIGCRDYGKARELVKRLTKVLDSIKADCEISLGGNSLSVDGNELIRRWAKRIVLAFTATLAAAIGKKHSRDGEELQKIISELEHLQGSPVATGLLPALWARRLFVHDLGRIPFRFRYFPYVKDRMWSNNGDGLDIPLEAVGSRFLNQQITKGVASFLSYLRGGEDIVPQTLPIPLLFPTRPFDIPEMYLLAPRIFLGDEKEKLRDWALAFRGYSPGENLPGTDQGETIVHKIPCRRRSDSGVTVAVTSWETKPDSWTAAATQRPDPDRGRYARLNRLLNSILSSRTPPDYVILPELSVPAKWFMLFAQKLANRGISLIAGIEYIGVDAKDVDASDVDAKFVANQTWASLTCNLPRLHPFVVCSQDKWQAAQEEECLLWNTAGVRLKPGTTEPKRIWHHGGFFFSILVCSELTNIDFRKELRGKVDAVFVPEWNQDTETFSALVEASALDIHAYIIQCNNRRYGDSRVRTPKRDPWERDLIRVKGGADDYFVVGKLDIEDLRRFQSTYRSAKLEKGGFKPVPDGFKIDPARELVP